MARGSTPIDACVLLISALPDELELLEREGCVGLRVRAKPGARRSRIFGIENGALVVAVAAPPREGLANQELVRLFARVASVPQKQVELVAGATGRYKLVRIHGVEIAELRKVLLEAAEND